MTIGSIDSKFIGNHEGGTVSDPEVKTAPQHQQHRLVLSHHSHETVHGTGTIARFNTWLAVRITNTVGTMWIAYLFAAIALISLPAAIATHQVIVIVAWIAQTFFQLVLLPIIIVGQNVIQATNDARAEADHETLTAVHKLTVEVHAINEAQSAILNQLRSASA
jgi:hypothetical protein